MQQMLFIGREPARSDVMGALTTRPKVLERRTVIARIFAAIRGCVGIYGEDLGDFDAG